MAARVHEAATRSMYCIHVIHNSSHATHGCVYHLLLLIQGPPLLLLRQGAATPRGPGAPTSQECESLHIQACGRGSWAVRELPSHSHIRQQCGQTLPSVVLLPDFGYFSHQVRLPLQCPRGLGAQTSHECKSLDIWACGKDVGQ